MIKTSELIWQDTQHQTLFRLIDQIRSEQFDRSVLNELRLYAEHHFRLEEVYMEALEFPHQEAHIKAHNQFRKELQQMAEMSTLMNRQLRESLSLFLEEWLKRHVLGIDKQFEQFVLESNRK